ncbi:MAG TPA: L-serine ammonia-lyase [Candidatus Acidoferrum sp.]|nr:L-serine ammonia-lyase [Candidatus Acidoferrum sp.]
MTGVFDLFKIGLGPSSSHTVGPMRAGAMFAQRLADEERLGAVERVLVELFGSLALTGKGHGTDRAVVLGLEGLRPDLTAPEIAESRSAEIRETRTLRLNGTHEIAFQEERDLVFLRHEVLARHPNAMRVRAFASGGSLAAVETYYSVGGGFVETDGESAPRAEAASASPYPFSSAADLLAIGRRTGLEIWEIVLANELASRDEATIRAYVAEIWGVIERCIVRGLATEGILPGGLNVRRRAPRLYRKLQEKTGAANGLDAMDEVNAVAMAVNEENAAGGRVVTAPTNGAAGVIPAVVHYFRRYADAPAEQGLLRFFLTATAIGALYKENASISGAEVGCQGEVGVACSMAAGGLVAALGGTNEQVEYAAEIGMEHSLGMTCDPIGGLVQIPCIERNAVGAVRAIHAARMAMQEDDEHRVSLDQVIEVMYRTGLDMQTKYKETSLGGLAVGVVEC